MLYICCTRKKKDDDDTNNDNEALLSISLSFTILADYYKTTILLKTISHETNKYSITLRIDIYTKVILYSNIISILQIGNYFRRYGRVVAAKLTRNRLTILK